MKTIILTQGKKAVVDDEDYGWLSKFNWYTKKVVLKNRVLWYAQRKAQKTESNKPTIVMMHREILRLTDPKLDGEHKNSDGLDNQRRNLRIATRTENQGNRHKSPTCSSRFKGVHWHKPLNKWCARIKISKKTVHLGYFTREEDAATAYDEAALKHFGEFSLTNTQAATSASPWQASD